MDLIFRISVFFPLLPGVLAILWFSRLSFAERIFGSMIWLIALNQLLAHAWVILTGEGNMPFFHVYILLETLMVCWFFYLILEQEMPRITLYILLLTFFLLWVGNVLWYDGIEGYPSLIRVLEGGMVIWLACWYFAKVLRERKIRKLHQTFNFWISAGLVTYSASSFMHFVFSTFIIHQSDDVFDAVWGVHALVTILLYITYAIAFVWTKSAHKSY